MEKFQKLQLQIKDAIRKLTKNGAAHVVIGSFLTKFASFFGSIFIIRLLSKPDYGILSYYENFTSYFTIFAGFGLASGLQRYLVIARKPEDKKGCYNRAISRGNIWNVCLIVICILLCVFYPHPDSFKGYSLVGIALAICIPFVFYVNASLSALRAEFDYKSFAFLAFLTAVILIAARVIGAAFGGLSLTTWARLCAQVVCAAICIILVYRKHFSGVKASKLDKQFLKEMDIYSFQIMLTDGLWAIFMLNDLFLLGQLSGSDMAIADYKVAYVIPANLSILTSAIGLFVAPYFTKHENEKDNAWVKKNFNLILKVTVLIMGVFALLCFVLAKPIILLLCGEQYLSAIPMMRILLIASFLNNGVRAPIANILSAMGIQKLNLYVAAGGMGLQIIMDLCLIPKYGGIGVAFSSSIVYLLMSIALGLIFWKKFYQ